MPGNICVNELFQFVCIVIKGHDCNNNVLDIQYNIVRNDHHCGKS